MKRWPTLHGDWRNGRSRSPHEESRDLGGHELVAGLGVDLDTDEDIVFLVYGGTDGKSTDFFDPIGLPKASHFLYGETRIEANQVDAGTIP